MFDPAHDLTTLQPAAYNPRLLDDSARQRLAGSLTTLGLIKPVIATQAGTLLAGHQRTSVALALGMTHGPAFILPDLSVKDEIRFNQLHNASDLELGDAQMSIPRQPAAGMFVDIDSDAISGSMTVRNAAKKNEILRLLVKHGTWGSAIANQRGTILVSRLYAMCCKILGMPCKTFIVPDELTPQVLEYFGQSYGKFSYAHLPKTTWAQSLAQMQRLRGDTATAGSHSRTYETLVIPRLRSDMRVLDFGAGQKDYASKLGKAGYHITPLEFYLHRGNTLDIRAGHRDISNVCADLHNGGRYDMVICDSVLNSVDSMQAERAVLESLIALCKPGGTIIFSGRAREHMEIQEFKQIRVTDNQRRLEFPDDDGITAMYSAGVWRYQKFHYYSDVQRLCDHYFGRDAYTIYTPASNSADGTRVANGKFSATAWGVVAQKTREIDPGDAIESLVYEFDLPLPGGKSYGRHADIVEAWSDALENE